MAAPAPRPVVVVATVAVVVSTGVLHLVLAPSTLAAEAWVGWSFVAGGVAMVLAGVVLAVPAAGPARRVVAVLAALAAVLMILLGVLSRTTGLPGGYGGPWSPLFVLSLVLEVAVVATAVPFVGGRGGGADLARRRSP